MKISNNNRRFTAAGLVMLSIVFCGCGNHALPPMVATGPITTAEDTPVSIEIVVGDSAAAENLATLVVTVTADPSHGTTTVDPTTKTILYTPAANYNGEDSFTVQVCDSGSPPMCVSVTVNVTVTPVNDAPVAVPDLNSISEDAVPDFVSGNVLANDSDVDTNDTLVVSGVAGSAANVGVLVAGTYGTVVLKADGSYIYTLNNALPSVQGLAAGQQVNDSFAYTVSDGMATADSTLTITIHGANDAPVANPDVNTIIEDAIPNTVSGFVLANDTDVDAADNITVSAIAGGAVGIPLPGAYGSITLNADGTYLYTLDNADPMVNALAIGETLTEIFDYTISDGTATADSTLTITINGANDAPATIADFNTITEDTPPNPVTGNVLTNDSDVDGPSPLTVSAVIGGTVGSSLMDTYGDVVINADGTYSYTLDNSLLAVHALGQDESVTDIFTYTASDGLTTANATLTITVVGVNDAPVANPDSNSVTEDAPPNPALGNVLDNDIDFDAGDDQLITQVNGAGANVGVLLQGTYGSITLNADGSYAYTLDNSSSLVQALADGQIVYDDFTYQMSDGLGATSSSTLTITITGANDDPVALPDAVTLVEDSVLTASGNILTNDSDVDATDVLTVTSLSHPDAPIIPLGVLIPGPLASGRVDTDGSYSVTLNNSGIEVQSLGQGQSTLLQFTYTISDGHSTVASFVTFNIDGANDAPVAVDDGPYEISTGTSINIGFEAGVLPNDTDVDASATRTAVLDTGPTHATSFNLNPDGSFHYTHDGSVDLSDSFTYHAQDEFGANSNIATVTFDIHVGPSANNDTYPTLVDTTLIVSTANGVIEGGAAATGSVGDTGNPPPTITFYGPVGGPLTTTPGSTYTLASGSTVTFDADGLGGFTYTPFTGFSTIDTFDYEITNTAGTDVATVTIVIQRPPTAYDDDPGPAFGVLLGSTVVYPPGSLFLDHGAGADDRGVPIANVVSFGPFTGNEFPAGATVTIPDGTMIRVDADGGGQVTPATTGIKVFLYRLQNSVGFSIATVTGRVNQGPTFTSATTTSFTVGTSGSFNLTATGFPTAMTFTNTGAALPSGVTLAADGTLSGIPAAGTGGARTLQFTASNGAVPNAIQNFTLIVNQAPAFTSAASRTFTVGANGSFSLTASGFPTGMTFTNTGAALPNGITLNASGLLQGTPAAATSGVYNLQFTASNGIAPPAVQNFTLTVNGAPTFTSANNTTFTIGTNGSFNVTASGFPAAMTFTNTGAALPPGVTLASDGTLSGIPAAESIGVYNLQFTASNGVAPNATQNFTLTVTQAPGAVNDPTPALSGTSTPGSSPYHIAMNGSISGTINVLTNDNLGFPAATLISFGPNLANVTLYTAGSTGFSINGGTVNLSANGSFTYTTPSATFTGLDTFAYRLSSSPGTSDAVVTIAVGVRPATANDTRAITGNIRIDTSTGTPFSVLTNDTGNQLTASLVNASNGQATVNANGTFTFNPAAGVTSGTSFVYNATNGFGSVQGTVTLNVSNMVWFVDNSLGTNGSGRRTDPFNVLSSAQAASSAGQVAFIYHNAGNYTDGYTLDSSERLLGQSIAFTLVNLGFTPAEHSTNLPTVGTNPTLTGTVTLANNSIVRGIDVSTNGVIGLAGVSAINVTVDTASISAAGAPAVTLSDSGGTITLAGVSSTGSATHGISLTNQTGTFTGNSGTIGTAAGNDFIVSGGTAGILYAGTITNTVGRSVSIDNHDSGNITLSGALSDTGTGLLVQNCNGGTVIFSGATKSFNTGVNTAVALSSNTGATINFSNGGLVITSITGMGYDATGGGTINVTGLGNTINSTSATALNVTDTTLGSLNFQAISSGNNTVAADPVNGIVLNNTGTIGSLVVTGGGNLSVGGNGSGGLIQNTSGHGVSLNNTLGPSFTNLNISGTGGSGVNGVAVTSFTFRNGTITNAGDANAESAIAFNGNPVGTSGDGNNIVGSLTVTGNILANPFYSGLDVQCHSGTLSAATVSTNTISPSTGAGVNFVGTGSTDAVFSLNKATISGNTITLPGIAGVQISMGNAPAGPGATAGIPGDATNIISITGNFVTPKSTGTQAMSVVVGGANSTLRSRSNFAISNNGTVGTPLRSSNTGTVILVGCNGYTTMTGTVAGNVISALHTPNLGGGNGIGGGNGAHLGGSGETPDLTLIVTGNTISGTDGNGILLFGRGATGTAKLKIANNSVGASVNVGGVATHGIRVEAGSAASVDDAVFLNMFSNTSAGRNGAAGLAVRKQGASPTTNDFGIYDATGGPVLPSSPNNGNIITFIDALNASGGGTEIISGNNYQRDTTQAPP